VGYNGPRWYTVQITMDPDEPQPWTVEEAKMEPDTISRVPLEQLEIIEFLKESLWGILLWNPSTEREDPVVWLSRGSTGQITYTFSPRRGLIGGRLVPEYALGRGHQIDARKKDEVAEFLLGFGLTPEEAEDVIQAVGVAPVKKPWRRKAETA